MGILIFLVTAILLMLLAELIVKKIINRNNTTIYFNKGKKQQFEINAKNKGMALNEYILNLLESNNQN